MPAAMTYDQNDPNAGWGQWALSKLHNAAVGGNLFNRVVQDSSTFGTMDKAQSLLPGSPSVDQLRAQTEQSRKDIGPYASAAADVLGTVAGPGELKVGEGLSALMGGSRWAKAGGAALENAGMNVAGTVGHGDTDIADNLKAAGWGLVTGGGDGGGIGVRLAKGVQAGVPSPTPGLETTAAQAFAPLSKTQYPTAAVERVINGVPVSQGLQSKISNSLSDQIDRIQGIVAKGGKTTASDIADFRASLLGAARNDTDSLIVQYARALENGVGPDDSEDRRRERRQQYRQDERGHRQLD